MVRQLDLLLATLLVILTFLAAPCTSFTPAATSTGRTATVHVAKIPVSASTTTTTKTRSLPSLNLSNKEEEGGTNKEESNTKNPVELASWYAVEAFGKVFGSKQSTSEINSNSSNKDTIDFTKPPSSLEETLKRIQIDNDRSYFLSGDVDRYIYDEQCTFADPFVSFDGRERFIDNLANLGSFITKYSAKMIKYDAEKDGEEIDTKVSTCWLSCIFKWNYVLLI